MSELQYSFPVICQRGFWRSPSIRLFESIIAYSLTFFQVQSGRMSPTRVLPECAKHGKGNVTNICLAGSFPKRMLGMST